MLNFPIPYAEELVYGIVARMGVRAGIVSPKQLLDEVEKKGFSKIAMVVDPVLRKRISEIYEKFGLQVSVLSHAELDSKANFAIEGTLEF